eukprot:COSAG01_NODE_30503_length_614_cov_10.485437_1_plen_71_part_00
MQRSSSSYLQARVFDDGRLVTSHPGWYDATVSEGCGVAGMYGIRFHDSAEHLYRIPEKYVRQHPSSRVVL